MDLNEPMNNEVAAPSQGTSPTEGTDDPRALVEKTNIAKDINDQKLKDLGEVCRRGFEADLRSRHEWETNLVEWTKLALQVKDEKTFPWVGASNVKYPLVSIASMQFNARAYPSLVPSSNDVVKCEVIGKDTDGQKLEKAKRIGTFMSYQVLNQMDGWEEDMDKLLLMLPIIGTVFKKTYYDSVKKQNCSELVLPKNLVVDYWAKSLDSAERVSEVLFINKRLLKERQMSDLWLDVDLGAPQLDAQLNQSVNAKGQSVPVENDDTVPYEIIEQHTFWDKDGDGYAEPYIVTFERRTGKVLRITARFDTKGVHLNDKGKLAKIEPLQYYTKYGFIPNPEGGFYDIGFGLLLSPLNESVNTLINQLIDSGTLANLQGGFLGKGLKLKMGESRWTPGEWKSVQSTADDLRKQIVPLPSKEPSDVLFKLMGTLITGAKELASVAEIFTGKMPGQNTPATTTMATVEQGMKVFTAVYKRVYRSLKSEFKKLFSLNSVYLDPDEYERIVDEPIGPDDFDEDNYDVCPGADPNTATQTEKLMKAQGLMELLQLGTLDVVEVTRRILDAQEQPSPEKLLNQQIQQTGQFQPPPDPKTQALQMKAQMDQQKGQADIQNDAMKAQLDAQSEQTRLAMEKQAHDQQMQHEAQMAHLKMTTQQWADQAKIDQAAQAHQMKMQQAQQDHAVQLKQSEETHKSQLQQQKQSMKTGSATRSPSSSARSSKKGK